MNIDVLIAIQYLKKFALSYPQTIQLNVKNAEVLIPGESCLLFTLVTYKARTVRAFHLVQVVLEEIAQPAIR